MQILFLSRWLPFPPDNGSKIRIHNLLEQLGVDHTVELIAFTERRDTQPALRSDNTRVHAIAYRGFRPYSRRAVAAALSGVPRFLVDTYQPEFSQAVAAAIQRQRPDLVVASQLDMVPYALQTAGVPLLLEELEVSRQLDAVRHGTPHQRARSALTWLKLSRYLERVLPRFAACTTVSHKEALSVRRAAPNYPHVTVVPNAVKVAAYAGSFGLAEPDSMVFTGALTYAPNLDAARFLVEAVFPKVVQRVPTARLRISGRLSDTTPRSLLATRPGVEFTGHVADIRPVIAQSSVAVVPIRIGGGTRLKILEAMALGTPVVATAKGAEGLDVHHGRELLIADDAPCLAEAVVQVWQNPTLGRQLSRQARSLIESRYDWNIVGEQIRSLVIALYERARAA